MSIGLAFRTFFGVLFSSETAAKVRQALSGDAPTTEAPPAKEPARPPKATRSEAITLLAALQRDARLVDLVMESLDGFSDAEIGAAARPVLQDTGKALERMFSLQPLTGSEEGTAQEVPANFDPAKIRLVGNVSGEAPYSGTIAHHGWQAQQVELPEWTGKEDALLVVAPTEVQVD